MDGENRMLHSRRPDEPALHDLVGSRDDVDGRDVDVELLMIELVHRLPSAAFPNYGDAPRAARRPAG
jgi:hypothetical protein